MTTLTASILFFLAVSILFYVLFAGADFGAGILELFLESKRRDDQRKLISQAIAPVWEANHVWLILAVVILFVGFPTVYTTISISLHLPMIAVLMGVVARGCAFTFRHYDTLGQKYHRIYTRVFSISSVWTSFFLGTLAGAMTLGRLNLTATDFSSLYLAPWFNLFSVSLGCFSTTLFALLASVYLVGETSELELKRLFRKKAGWFSIATMILGVVVFGLSEVEGLGLAHRFFTNPVSLGSFVLATLLWFPFWKKRMWESRDSAIPIRVIAATIVALVLFGWYAVQFPVAIGAITFTEAAAPKAVLKPLLGALICGSLLIFPSLGYLFVVFKDRR